MPALSPMDEYFVHQIPEPYPNVATWHEHWRDSLFFILHPRDGLGDVVILTLAHFPARGVMDSLQLGRWGGEMTAMRHEREVEGDHHEMRVGPVTIEIVEPFQRVVLRVVEGPTVPISLDLTFTARTAAYGLRRGTMKAAHETIWDQSHLIQSGTYTGTVTRNGVTTEIVDWWGQRDHSWGIRDHARCPMWMWLAIQLPEGMFGVWCWELANGARIYTDGCFAPDGGSPADVVPVVRFDHDLTWLDDNDAPVSYGRDGETVSGLSGHVDFVLEGGRHVGFDAEGRWAQRYGPVGGGLSEMVVRSSDGSAGTAIYEITGAHHHRYFPVSRASGPLPR